MYCVWQVVKTPTIISNNSVFYSRSFAYKTEILCLVHMRCNLAINIFVYLFLFSFWQFCMENYAYLNIIFSISLNLWICKLRREDNTDALS